MSDRDCEKLVEQLYGLLDGEIGEHQVEFLKAHLDECGDCLMRLGVESHFTRMVQRRCAECDCPDQLLVHIKQSLRAEIVF